MFICFGAKEYKVKKVEQRVFRWKDVDSSKKWDLEHSGYYYISKKGLDGKEQSYYFKPFFHESARHGILVFEIAECLKKYTNKIKVYGAVRPDIIFEIDGKEWAFEIETGLNLKKHKKIVLKKVENLKENYGRRWFFVVTNRNCLKSYQRYGKTLTKRNVVGKINKIMRENGVDKICEKEPSGCENDF